MAFFLQTQVIIPVLIVLLLVGYFISTGNKLRRMQVKISEADSGIDVALTQRFDTLTKMFELAKSYLKQEQALLLEAIRLRAHMPIAEKQTAELQLDEAQRQLNLVAEAYPALSSQSLFVELQRSIAHSEENLQAARRMYNANVSQLNQAVVSFPASIVAALSGTRQLPMYDAPTQKREDVRMAL